MQILQTDALFDYACAVLRPAWNGEKVTGLQEALALLSHPVSWALVVFAALALWTRKRWLIAALGLAWITWAVHILVDQLYSDPTLTAIKVGCIGNAQTYLTLGSAGVAAVAFIIFLRTPRSKPTAQ